MKAGSALWVVGLNCPPEFEEKFDKWYDKHIAIMMKFPGLKSSMRFKAGAASETFRGKGETETEGHFRQYPNYLALYEFESEKAFNNFVASPVFKEMIAFRDKTWPGRHPYEARWRGVYDTLKVWEQ